MEPMLDREDTVLLGLDNFAKIQAQLAAGENVVLLSNHQTEADPSAWSFIMDPVDQNFAKNMILVAGSTRRALSLSLAVARDERRTRAAPSLLETLFSPNSRRPRDDGPRGRAVLQGSKPASERLVENSVDF